MEKAQKTVNKVANTTKATPAKVAAEVKEVKSVGTQLFDTATDVVTEIKETTIEMKDVVVEAANEITEKVDFTENVEKIKESVNAINSQLKETAADIVSEVKEMSSEIKAVATKGIKEVAKKVDLEKNVKEIKAAAQKANAENIKKVKAVAEKVNAQVVENAEEFKKTATKLANEVVENLKISDRLNAVKDAMKNANEYALETSHELIEGMEANGLKWQSVTEKAVKTGLKLAENQQNLVFSTLEAVKTQIGTTSDRFKKLFA